MKRIGIALALSLLLAFSASCAPANKDYTIHVGGTDGLPFSGSYMVLTAEGQSISRSVNGIVPQTPKGELPRYVEYKVQGTIVSCAFQKQTSSGYLIVMIISDEEGVNSSTTAPYGVVSVAIN